MFVEAKVCNPVFLSRKENLGSKPVEINQIVIFARHFVANTVSRDRITTRAHNFLQSLCDRKSGNLIIMGTLLTRPNSKPATLSVIRRSLLIRKTSIHLRFVRRACP